MNDAATEARTPVANLRGARLWLCADAAALAPDALLTRVREALAALDGPLVAGRIVLWLRSASTRPSREALSLARSLRAITREHSALLVVGERADLAALCEADGVHVTHAGPTAVDVARYLSMVGARAALSAAAHDRSEARALAPAVTALVVSPFGAVPQKNAPLGPAGLSAIVSEAPARAIVALGGIDSPAQARLALACGATAVAVRRPLLDGDLSSLRALADVLTDRA